MKNLVKAIAIGILVYILYQVFLLARSGMAIGEAISATIFAPFRLIAAMFTLLFSPTKLKQAAPYAGAAVKAVILSPFQAALSLPIVQENLAKIYNLAFGGAAQTNDSADTTKVTPSLDLNSRSNQYQYVDYTQTPTDYAGKLYP